MKMRKPFLLLIIFLMAFSNVALAANGPASKNLNAEASQKKERELVKTLNKDQASEKYKPNDKVRVIVELKGKPAMLAAQSSGKNYQDLSESSKKQLRQEVLKSQTDVKKAMKSSAIPMEYKESFTTVVNGFSGEVTYKSIEVIESLSNVEKVHISNKYERPEEQKPDMIYSKELVKAQQTWADYGYKGEGMTVAVIDTGIDPDHRDMVLSDETTPELSEKAVNDYIAEKSLSGKYYTEKVPYAYNYADENHEVRDLGPGASMHGMHVSGTVGANGDEENGGLKGVAPEAQILGMKVFGNDPEMPSTWSDIYVKAIDDAIILGADVINMSLGSTAAFVLPEDPEQKAIERAVNNGVMMAISAGNSAYFGNGAENNPFASNPDIGVVGSPGLSNDSLQVASFENQYLDLEGFNVMIDGESADPVAYLSASDVHPSTLGEGNHEVVYAGLGRKPGDSTANPDANDFENVDVEGKIALIKRGEAAFVDKTLNAQEEGAIGVIIFNHSSGYVSMASDSTIEIPQLFILKEDGDVLHAALEEGKKVELAFKGEKVTALNPDNNKLSSFTSWGVTPNLDFKPEITAPGGNILSTLNDDKYGLMSGTSMAAPHVAGGSALVMQRVDEEFNLSGSERVEMTKNILMNTSQPKEDKGFYNDHPALDTDLLYSPRRQGAGLMDLHAAMSTPVVVTEVESGIGKVALKEMDEKTTFKLKLTNYSDKNEVYKAMGTVQTDLIASGLNQIETQGIFKAGTTAETAPYLGEYPLEISSVNGADVDDEYQILVPANDSVEVEVTVDLKDTVDWWSGAALDDVFENGYFVEGFISFMDINDTHPELNVPYVGFKGDWDQAPIVDETIYEENSFYGMTGLVSPSKDEYSYLGTNPVSEDAHGDKVAFSPNGDNVNETILPVLSLLRNAKKAKFSILDENKDEILTLRTENELRKHYYDRGAASQYTIYTAADWDGKYKGKVMEDGMYYYEVKTVVDYKDADWQMKQIPFYIDTKDPVVETTYDTETGKVTWAATDEGVGISYIDVLVNGKSVLESPLAGDQTEYTLKDMKDVKSVKVVATDWAGNVGMDSTGEDNTVPFITAKSPEALGVFNEREIDVDGYINDDSAVEELYINGKKTALAWDDEKKRYTFKTTVEFKSDGVKQIRFMGKDAKGNELSFLRTVIIDSTKPIVEVEGPYYTDKTEATLDLKLTDNFDYMRFYIDGSEVYYNEFKEPYEMRAHTKSLSEKVSLEEGKNHFELKLVDMAGNTTVKKITIVQSDKKAKDFKDIKSNFWAKDAIQTLNVMGVINGYTNGDFGVNDEVTRLQAAQMIVRALGLETDNLSDPKFSDVKKEDYKGKGYEEVAAIANAGIMTGYNGKFNPKATLTRAEMAKIIVGAYDLEGSSKDRFNDVPVGHWAADYINTLVANDMVAGYPDGSFKPNKGITRSEFATLLVRALDDRFK
ncbi:S8 family serine peptidase [Pseudalkalibacillus berkeleyi]|uniref:S8 family serine peptidase n=1 Tax=Pseudalkalibacillus berkeleyi TaxID=1069813 RepID=A0ABS9H3V1_9BACL|nr:S8 family serine peptidase [Pseudalkalibacillus berkeleyi]MCF6138781.1 S8 family serine peptidase [Pseudalkalibacillus berkeleyi]